DAALRVVEPVRHAVAEAVALRRGRAEARDALVVHEERVIPARALEAHRLGRVHQATDALEAVAEAPLLLRPHLPEAALVEAKAEAARLEERRSAVRAHAAREVAKRAEERAA